MREAASPVRYQEGIKAVRPISGDSRALPRFGDARVCVESDCDTVLSAYNPGHECWQHEGRHPFDRQLRRTEPPGALDIEILERLLAGQPGSRRSNVARLPGPAPEPGGPPQPAPVPPPGPVPAPEPEAGRRKGPRPRPANAKSRSTGSAAA